MKPGFIFKIFFSSRHFKFIYCRDNEEPAQRIRVMRAPLWSRHLHSKDACIRKLRRSLVLTSKYVNAHFTQNRSVKTNDSQLLRQFCVKIAMMSLLAIIFYDIIFIPLWKCWNLVRSGFVFYNRNTGNIVTAKQMLIYIFNFCRNLHTCVVNVVV